MERLQKIIAARGLCSRRQAEQWIAEGRVSVNGRTAALGQTADPEADSIAVGGKPLPKLEQRVYLMLHKPRGYVTTLSDEKGRPDVSQLVADCGCRVYPVGRLDMDSEGLLLLTNDGAFADRLMHPRHEKNKVYLAWVTGFTEAGMERLSQPMELDGYALRKPGLKLVRREGEKALLRITIHEGRNRQVRRMCQLAGMTVTRLKRTAEGGVELGDLQKGAWRHLTEQERRELQK